MQARQEKGAKTLVKKEGGTSGKSNGVVVKKEVVSNGYRKESLGKSSANGSKTTVKKEEVDVKPDKKKEASTSGVKAIVKKSVTTTKVKTVKTEEKKEKKVFTLPGQKHEAPEERDPLRIFYESLHEQLPGSEMAQFWMMEHGLLESGHAKKVLEKKQRRQHSERNGTPMKSSTSSRDVASKPADRSSIPNGKGSKLIESKGKRKRIDDDDDDDFIKKPVKRKLKP